MRSPGERVADFVTRVKHLAVACKFTAGERPARFKDRFISGLQDSKMVSAILRQKCEDITFSTVVETVAAVERTLRDVRAIAVRPCQVTRESTRCPVRLRPHERPLVRTVARLRNAAGRAAR